MNDVRKSGLTLLLIAGAIAAAFGFFAMKLTREGWGLLGLGWGIPGAFALAGLVQLVSGVPFSELAARWDSLKGWQRGVLGLLIVGVAVGAIFLGLMIFARLMWGE
jgi:hypothetical protein